MCFPAQRASYVIIGEIKQLYFQLIHTMPKCGSQYYPPKTFSGSEKDRLGFCIRNQVLHFPGGRVVKNLPANAEDTGLIPSPRRSHMQQSN